eukprot:9293438-Pyramimonas_sp.AAC.1
MSHVPPGGTDAAVYIVRCSTIPFTADSPHPSTHESWVNSAAFAPVCWSSNSQAVYTPLTHSLV